MKADKKRYAIYYLDDAAAAKARAQALREDGGNSAILIDAAMFRDIEQVDLLIFMPDVPAEMKKNIEDAYDGAPIRKVDPTDAYDGGSKVEVPKNWKTLSWTQLQAIAAEIKPDETIRNKTEAKRIIADYLDDNETYVEADEEE